MFIEQKDFNDIKQSLPINAVELLILDSADNVLLFKRTNEPAKDLWWLPGGRILFAETRLDAAKRLLKEECGITEFDIQKLGMFEYSVENKTENYSQHIISTVYVIKKFKENSITIDSQTSSYQWQSASEWLKNIQNNFLESILSNGTKITPQFIDKSFSMEKINSNGKENFIKPELYSIILKAMSVPCVDIFVTNSSQKILLVKRKNAPAKNEWWVPGGRVLFGEKRIDTAKRKLKEEVGLDSDKIKEIMDYEFVFNTPNEPVYHNITTVFDVKVDNEEVVLDNQSSDYSWRLAEDWLKEELDEFIVTLIENRI